MAEQTKKAMETDNPAQSNNPNAGIKSKAREFGPLMAGGHDGCTDNRGHPPDRVFAA